MPAEAEKIIAQIAKKGPISVADYMSRALDVYYGKREPFGRSGDFVTAPEVSQMFGEMLAAWFVDVWLQIGKLERVHLVELGPGRGTLMADMLRTFKNWPDMEAALDVHLVEISPRLRKLQQKALKGYNVTWHDNFDTVPEGFTFIVANEFFDALPIHQFEKVKGVWKERGVKSDGKKLHFTHLKEKVTLLASAPEEFADAPDGSIFEVSPASLEVAEKLAKRIEAHGGAALIIDYGHGKSALGETLQAISHHTYADPLENPGLQDITAHVDFGMLRTTAEKFVTVSPLCDQGPFLLELGITARARKLAESGNRENIMADLDRLTDPDAMGHIFKVMAFTPKSAIIQPAGFAGNEELSDKH